MNTEQLIVDRLRSDADVLDRLLADALKKSFVATKELFGDPFQWREAHADLLRLSKGDDAFYDRAVVGVDYASWYHLRRINPVASSLVSRIGAEALDIVDLGSGTGATAWAAAMVIRARRALDLPTGPVRVFEVEGSVGMAMVADQLWQELDAQWPTVAEGVERTTLLGNWAELTVAESNRAVVIASYLLDHSDHRRAAEIGVELARVARRCGANELLHFASASKADLSDAVGAQIEHESWEADAPHPRPADVVWSGRAPATSAARLEICHSVSPDRGWECDVGFNWERPMLAYYRHEGDHTLGLDEPGRIVLNECQRRPLDSNRPARLVIGAAGSGKTVVLARALLERLEQPSPGGPPRVLVTAFNKAILEMVDRLVDEWSPPGSRGLWGRHSSGAGRTVFDAAGRSRAEVALHNWDKVIPAAFDVDLAVQPELFDLRLAERVEALRRDDRRFADLPDGSRLSDPEFYIAELERVIYGLGYIDRAEYVSTENERTGRGIGLGRRHREMVWEVLFESDLPSTFVHRRIEALRRLRSGERPRSRYDSVFVDEAQDFLPSDFELLGSMVDEDSTAFVVVDETQGLHIGASYRSPQAVVPGRRWERFELDSSYRLPPVIAKALAPLAEAVEGQHRASEERELDLRHPVSRKASLVGVRPIVVVGSTEEQAEQIREIEGFYRPLVAQQPDRRLPLRRVFLYEQRSGRQGGCSRLLDALAVAGVDAYPETIRATKGLERPVVVWDTATRTGEDTTRDETVFTILSRATAVAVIAVDPDRVPEPNRRAVAALDREFLMPWTEEAARWLG